MGRFALGPARNLQDRAEVNGRRRWLFALALSGCGGTPSTDPMIINDPVLPGGLRVSWSFELQDGTASSCVELEVARALVSVGGLPGTGDGGSFLEVECGESQVVQFDGLPTGPRPVILAALAADGDTVAEYSTTISISSEMTTEVEHIFTLSGTGPAVGDLAIGWTIDRREPASRCTEVGGRTTRLATTVGSIEDFDVGLPCEEGAASFEDLRRGTYFVRLTLQDADGLAIAFAEIEAAVTPGGQGIELTDFVVDPPQPARLVATWTIGGQAPASACGNFGADEVEVRVQNFDPDRLRFIDGTLTGTAACDASGIDLGAVSTVGLRRLAYRLVDTSLGDRLTLSSTVSQSFLVEEAQTSTISTDIPAPL